MRPAVQRFLRFLVPALLAQSAPGCGKEDLKELDQYQIIDAPLVQANVDFCTSLADKVKSRLKFIFVIDKSGSNQNLPDELGTDVDGKRRYTPLLSYLKGTEADDTVYYSLVNLSTEAKVVSPFTNDVAKFTSLVQTESNPSKSTPPKPADGGWTNFKSALGQVHRLIDDDIKAAKEEEEIISSYYVVFFVSDGAPWVGTNDLQDKTDILASVGGILAFQEGNREYVDSIQVHTGYYYNDQADADAQSYMKDMGDRGNGQSYEFSAGQIIDFSQFSVPERNVAKSLRDILLTNTNIAWEAGELLPDTDGDGLNDRLEDELKSDKTLWDSDKNGVSDAIEYRITSAVCKDPACSSANAEPYQACAGFKRKYPVNGQIFNDKDNDGLNDCEEQIILKSKIDNFDSNEDWVPDPLGFQRGLAVASGAQEASLDPDLDDVSNYNEVKLNTPTNYPNDKILGLTPYEYKLDSGVKDESRVCYHLTVKNIALATDKDLLRLYLMESTSIIDTKRFLRVAEKTVVPGETEVTVVPEDFK